MNFTIRTSTNPHTAGKGACFHIEVEQSRDVRNPEPPLRAMFDTFGPKPGVTTTLSGIAWINDAGDTDEGCYVSFANSGGELTVVLPMTLANLLNAISTTMEFKDREEQALGLDSTDVAAVRTHLRSVGSDIDAPDREDYEPNAYDGTYSED